LTKSQIANRKSQLAEWATGYSRFLFERMLAAMYLVGFAVARQSIHPAARRAWPAASITLHSAGPVPHITESVFSFSHRHGVPHCAWLGIVLAVLTLIGWPQQRGSVASATVWGLMWLLYLSFVNVGQTFYSFGWETLLLESGFLAIFLGGSSTAPSVWLIWLYRWLLFRVMFGAGLIKIRGDSCWRDLTCLNYYFETQPIPNPLSWYFSLLPEAVHKGGVAFNHFAELVVPFGYFAPQPFAGVAALLTIIFQGVLIASGNLSWLNWLTLSSVFPRSTIGSSRGFLYRLQHSTNLQRFTGSYLRARGGRRHAQRARR
jgi:hypothetical protein